MSAAVGVGLDLGGNDTAWLLGGQDHVDPHAASPLGDVHQPVHEVGHFRLQGGELVDHHHQRSGDQVLVRCVTVDPGQLLQVARRAAGQQLLPASQFGPQ